MGPGDGTRDVPPGILSFRRLALHLDRPALQHLGEEPAGMAALLAGNDLGRPLGHHLAAAIEFIALKISPG